MAEPAVYCALSDHGFGHATRAASIMAHVRRLDPAVRVVFVGSAPRWLLEQYMSGVFELRPCALDVGVAQSDSLTIDFEETDRRLSALRERREEIVAGEAEYAARAGVGLVVGDIPPLAASVAQAAEVPCWMVGNFGWDFIYGEWGGRFVEHAAWIADCYRKCDRLFRPPFHEPMTAFDAVTEVGLTGGDPRFAPDELRAELGIRRTRERTVLLTFGGLGLSRMPYEAVAAHEDWLFLTHDAAAPELANLVRVPSRRLRPVDLMPLCSRVIGKPGYSTYSEATRLGVPIVAVPRTGFPEAEILLEGIRDHAYHQLLVSGEEFFEGSWDFLDEEPSPPCDPSPIALDGSEAVARQIVEYLEGT